MGWQRHLVVGGRASMDPAWVVVLRQIIELPHLCIIFVEKKTIRFNNQPRKRDNFYCFFKWANDAMATPPPPPEDLGIARFDHLRQSINQGHNLSSCSFQDDRSNGYASTHVGMSTHTGTCPYQYWPLYFWDASSSTFCSVVATTLGIYLLELNLANIPILALQTALVQGSHPVPAWARSITSTGIQWCPCRYWYFCTLVQYQYWHGPLPVLTFSGSRTGIGIFTLWSSMVPVCAQSITGTGIQLCPYQ